MSHSDAATTTLSIVSKTLEGDRRQVFAEFLSFPPSARFPMLVAGCKSVSIESGPDVARRFLWKRIAREESPHIRFAFEQENFEVVEPQIFPRRSQCGEPHLPIEPRLMRRAPARCTRHVARLPFEFVRQPIDPVRAAFDHDLFTIFRHHAEKSVAIRDSKWLDTFVNCCDRPRPFRIRFECG